MAPNRNGPETVPSQPAQFKVFTVGPLARSGEKMLLPTGLLDSRMIVGGRAYERV